MGIAVKLTETSWGYELKTDEITILFGAMRAQTVDLRKAFPDFQFTRLKQIHSDAVLETTRQGEKYRIRCYHRRLRTDFYF